MKNTHTIWPLVIFFYSLLLPPEVFFEISGFRFYGFRMIEYILFPYVLFQMINGGVRFNFVDMLNVFFAFWLIFSYSVIHDLAFALESGTVLAADVLIAYLIIQINFFVFQIQ